MPRGVVGVLVVVAVVVAGLMLLGALVKPAASDDPEYNARLYAAMEGLA